MSNALYRPLDSSALSSADHKPYHNTHLPRSRRGSLVRHYWAKSMATRKFIAFGLLITLLLVYFVWCGGTDVPEVNEIAGKSDDSEQSNVTIVSSVISTINERQEEHSIQQRQQQQQQQEQQIDKLQLAQQSQLQQGFIQRSIAFVTAPSVVQRLRDAVAIGSPSYIPTQTTKPPPQPQPPSTLTSSSSSLPPTPARPTSAPSLSNSSSLSQSTSISSLVVPTVVSVNVSATVNASTIEAAVAAMTTTTIMMGHVPNSKYAICTEQFIDSRAFIANKPRRDYDNLPIIYFVTPTYPRREQVAELTRLAHTLLHVPRIHWILANDYDGCNIYLDYALTKFGLPFTHLVSPMPDLYRKKKLIPRGVSNRRAALQWLRQRNITQGVLYFGDDDNTYDLKLFSEIRDTMRVSMFPVGLIEEYVSGPVVRKGKVIGFLDSWVADRHWPVDMAGFAVNLAYMAEHPNASMPYKPGYEEDYFLRSLALKLNMIEPKGNNCTEILVWHTQTKNHNRSTIHINRDYLNDRSNLGALFKSLELMGVAVASDTEGEKPVISKNGKAKPLSYFLS